MWIPIWENAHQLWVRDDQCYFDSGELAFVNESIPTPLPAWFAVPPGSTLRMSDDERHVAGGLLEHRSMEATADHIVAFYRNRIERGGLKVTPEAMTPGLPGRCCPGFSAEGAHDRFTFNVYQRKHLAFWTVYLSHHRRWKSVSVPLNVISRTPDRLTLWIANEKRECWAPASAVTDRYPGDPLERFVFNRRREPEVIPTDALPPWLRFTIREETPIVLTRYPGDQPLEHWEGRFLLPATLDPYVTFERWLDHIDANGFDASGVTGSNSYYLTVWQQGQMLSATVEINGEDQGGISLLNSGERSISARYVRRRPTG